MSQHLEIEARWAGYLIEQYSVTHDRLESTIAEIKERFEEGIQYTVYGSSIRITVLCIDVFSPPGEDGHYRIVRQCDFKK